VWERRPRRSQAGTTVTRTGQRCLLTLVRTWLLTVCLLIGGVTPLLCLEAAALSSEDVEWLTERSMLLQGPILERKFARRGQQWRHPYGRARPDDFLQRGSVWLAVYPEAILGHRGSSVLQTLGDPALLDGLGQLGIEAIHTGPLQRAGGVSGRHYTPSVDGHFDRIELAIDPAFGSEAQYQTMVQHARERGIMILGDLVPGHTGKGADFRLAERNVDDFPGLYSMVEIEPRDWSLLPPVPKGEDSVNLSQATAQALEDRGYIVGPLDTLVFGRPGIKASNWSATDIIRGVDGKERRWVYLHIFKRGQPSLNWLDPSFAAQRLVAADAIHALAVLGVQGLRLDATMFLGAEAGPGAQKGWLSGHPLSNHTTATLAMVIRKFGGYSFQELNVPLDQLRDSFTIGPELSYDFSTRPAYLYALVTGDGGPLRLMLRELLAHKVQAKRLVHALQNHDELMLEATHLKTHGDETFTYEGEQARGATLFERLHRRVLATITGDHAPYNERFAMSPGVCSTIAGAVAAAFGVRDLQAIAPDQFATIRQAHLVAAAYNAMQPGAFALSGWDLVGALPLSQAAVRERLADEDCRWRNRGAYDLLGSTKAEGEPLAGLSPAVALYGPLPAQLTEPTSFASRLREMLGIRKAQGIAQGRLVAVPRVQARGLVLLVNELPARQGQSGRLQLTILNFGRSPVEETIQDIPIQEGSLRAIFSTRQGTIDATIETKDHCLHIALEPLEAKILVQQ
jgi:trehalose synthase